MKIEVEGLTTKCVGVLCPGEVMKYNGEWYLKIHEIDRANHINFLNMFDCRNVNMYSHRNEMCEVYKINSINVSRA